jgi:uncharacterized protein (DUF58 family)
MLQRRLVVFVLMILALVSGLATRRPLPLNLAYLLAGLLLISLIWTWTAVNWVRLSRYTRAHRAQVGRHLEERFSVTNTSILPKVWLEIRDESTLPGHYAGHVAHGLSAHGEQGWTVHTLCRRRGRYRLGPVTLRAGDPFGLWQMQRKLTPTSAMVVYPMTFSLANFTLPLGMISGGDALRRRSHMVTVNAAGVRDYQPGDSFSRIHWRSTARRDRLVVKEFELDPQSDVWLFVDMHRDMQFGLQQLEGYEEEEDPLAWLRARKVELPIQTEEYIISSAASIAQFFTRHDRAVGVAGYGQAREILQADRGERQLMRIFETLAVLRAEGRTPFHEVLATEAQYLPRGTTVVALTASIDQRWVLALHELSRRGLRAVAVVVDASTFFGPSGAAGTVALLSARGIPAYLVKAGDKLDEVLSGHAPAGKWLFRDTA